MSNGKPFWGLWALGLALGVVLPLSACKTKRPPAFSCDAFQKRTERCEAHLLTALKERYDADVKTGARTASEAAGQLKMLEWRIRKRIRHQGARRLCEKSQEMATRQHQRRFSTLRYCFSRPGCAAFARCMLDLW